MEFNFFPRANLYPPKGLPENCTKWKFGCEIQVIQIWQKDLLTVGHGYFTFSLREILVTILLFYAKSDFT